MLRKLPLLIWLIGGLFLVMVIAAGVNGGSVKRSLEYAFATLMFCLVIEYGIQRNLRALLGAGVWFFGVLTAINLITICVFPRGMYRALEHYWETWFLGFKSGHIPYHMAFLFFAVLYAVLCDREKWSVVYIGILLVFVSNLTVKNRTAILVLLPLIAVIFIPRILKFTRVMNILTYAGAGIVMNLLFVVFRKQELFRWLIVGVFHRRMDLTYRTGVWDAAFQVIREHLYIGHGYSTFEYSPIIVTTHNEVLEVLYKTGLTGLILFLIILVLAVIRLFRNRKLETAQWISIFLGAYFLMFVMEQYAFANFFFILLFAWHCADLRMLADTQEERRRSVTLKGTGSDAGRTGKSARNFAFTLFANVTAILIGLIAQRLFIRLLGLEYAGLNGLFSNVITMLAIADLGIGEAVVFHLYRPLEEGDTETVKSLMQFYRRAFHIVAGVIAVAGLCLIPALPYLAKPTEADVSLTVIYLIFLADVVFSYFLSYKRAILYADQKNYIISTIHMLYLLGMNTGQLAMLYITHNYYAYLLIKVVFRILENVVITARANRMYPYLRERDVRPLTGEIRADIKKKVGALFFHKIGTFAVNGTDNILILTFLGLMTAGLYNNYYLVIDAATKLFGPALTALTPSVGNMLVTDKPEHWFAVFRRIRFMSFWIATCAATALLV
ncbi:MAG: O-antigen ligase family protein, partial [Eubacterium sp.]|nr:O-antigen ligase family protein [Eubacterium sp.]